MAAWPRGVGRVELSIGHARQRMSHGLLESLGPAPLLRRPAFPVRADLIHRGVELDIEPVGVLELDARITPRAPPPFIYDRHALGAEKVANLEQFRDVADLQGTMVKAGLSSLGSSLRVFAGTSATVW